MNKRRGVYRGFNKRRKSNLPKFCAIMTILIVGGYGAYKVKQSNPIQWVKNKISSIELPTFDILDPIRKKEEYEYEDLQEELDKPKEEPTQDIKNVTINGWKFYSIQVASIDRLEESEKIEEELKSQKIPYSIMSVDEVSKVQTYGSLDKDQIREKLEEVRKLYPDAFLSEIDIPVLSLQYTDKYSYTEKISTQLNTLIESFKEESEFWSTSSEDMAKYNEILTKRRESIQSIQDECEKIDYDGAKVFKDNLITYMSSLEKNIDESSKYANQEIYSTSQGLFLTSMQEYFLFINSIQ